jgi:hypothetical protein
MAERFTLYKQVQYDCVPLFDAVTVYNIRIMHGLWIM